MRAATIIIPNYNGASFLGNFLQSLYAQSDIQHYEVIIIDDCSTDTSAALLQEMQKTYNFNLVSSPHNQGYAACCNLGVAKGIHDILIFMNTDIKFYDIDTLKCVIDAVVNESIGVVGLTQHNEDGSLQFNGANIDCFCSVDYRKKIQNKKNLMCGGAFFATKRSLFDTIGAMDESYFLYVEELDYMRRVWLVGYEVLTLQKKITHFGGLSTGNKYNHTTSSKKIYLRERNALISMLKNYSLYSLCIVLPLLFILHCAEVAYLLLTRKYTTIRSYYSTYYYIFQNGHDIFMKRRLIQKLRKRSDYFFFSHGYIRFTSFKISYILNFGIPSIR